jgi:hypothetical protein
MSDWPVYTPPVDRRRQEHRPVEVWFEVHPLIGAILA